MKIYRLQELKTNQLRKLYLNGNIDEDQFNSADKFFKEHPVFEKEIDWNKGLKITWDDLEKVIKKERNSKSQAKKKIRKGLEGFKEGEDYIILDKGTYKGEPWIVYQPFTWEASRMIASHYVEPSEDDEGYVDDANWCTAYQKSSIQWDKHNKLEAFIYICGESVPTKKVAISISKEKYDANNIKFRNHLDNLNFTIWDFINRYYIVKKKDLLKLIPNLNYLIKKAYKNWDDNTKKQLLSKFKLNPQTDRYDYEGNLSNEDLEGLVSEDKDGFIVNFGEVTGDFNCFGLELISLKGSPHTVGGDFYCGNNPLTSLEGAPKTVGGSFYCGEDPLNSLEGAPHTVWGDFECSHKYLNSLEGSPHTIGGNFNCYGNHLTSLKGSPQIVGGDFDCFNNWLTSLEGAPQRVAGDFDCRRNEELHSLDGIGKVEGEIYKDF